MNPIKRVPKWAWLVAGGVGVGGVALRFIGNKRDADAALEAGTTGTDPATGAPVGTGAPGVIVPPVIMGGGSGDDGAGSAALSDLAGVLGQGFSSVLDTAKGLAWTPAEVAGLVGTSQYALSDSLTSLIAGAGLAPSPVAQVPTVINVMPPAPAPTPAPTPAPAKGICPSGYPNGTPPNCYRDVKHCDTDSKGKKYTNWGHLYSSGKRVHVKNTPGC